ncbi:MAG: sulfite exporter TauE/SafE family protein [Actinomycetes bacterium]
MGIVAGAINAAVGSGTLLSYPVLLAIGLPAIPANATNTVGLFFGSVSATASYRSLLVGRWRRLRWGLAAAMTGGTCGALLVLSLPPRVFSAVVPWLILFAAGLVAIQTRFARWVRRRWPQAHENSGTLAAAALPTSIYSGYFGAGQGVLFLAVLGLTYDSDVQRANAAKNLLGAVASGPAAVVFAISGRVNWWVALILAVAALIGGQVGGRTARRLSPAVLRGVIVLVGVVASVSLLVKA